MYFENLTEKSVRILLVFSKIKI